MGGFLLAFRESLEAALVVSVMLSVLHRTGRTRLACNIWLGAGAGVLASLATAGVFGRVAGGFSGAAEALFEGILMLTAAALLTTMIIWMAKQGSNMGRTIQAKMENSFGRHEKMSLFVLALVAVWREGVETVLFLAAARAEGGAASVGAGFLGMLAAIVLGILIYRGTVHLNIRAFFRWIGVLLLFVAAGLVGHGVHELNEIGLIPELVEHVWDLNTVLNENGTVGALLKAMFGYNGNPSLTEAFAWLAYLVAAWRIYSAGVQRAA